MKGGRGAAPLKNGVTGVLRVTRGLNYLNLHNIKPVTQFLFCMCIKCYKSNLCNALPANPPPPTPTPPPAQFGVVARLWGRYVSALMCAPSFDPHSPNRPFEA